MKKGFSIASLIIYVFVLSIVIGMVAMFNFNIIKGTTNLVDSVEMYEEYTKFNMYFLKLLESSPLIKLNDDESISVITASKGIIDITLANNKILSNDETISSFVEVLKFTKNGDKLNVDLGFERNNYSYNPIAIDYVIGGWYDE